MKNSATISSLGNLEYLLLAHKINMQKYSEGRIDFSGF